MNIIDIKQFLDEKVIEFNTPSYIQTDPIQIPHSFTQKEDIEISAFLTSTIAWGNRKSIITNAKKLMQRLDNAPYEFTITAKSSEIEKALKGFVHRTFNEVDAVFFIQSLQNIYKNYGGIEHIFSKYSSTNSTQEAITEFKTIFFSIPHPSRTLKHISNPAQGSAAKRINMFLRWMVRQDSAGVDFGIWKNISMQALSCPLDVHSGNVARSLGILTRMQNDSKALQELDSVLRKFDPLDPVKYDYALFGLGVFEGFR